MRAASLSAARLRGGGAARACARVRAIEAALRRVNEATRGFPGGGGPGPGPGPGPGGGPPTPCLAAAVYASRTSEPLARVAGDVGEVRVAPNRAADCQGPCGGGDGSEPLAPAPADQAALDLATGAFANNTPEPRAVVVCAQLQYRLFDANNVSPRPPLVSTGPLVQGVVLVTDAAGRAVARRPLQATTPTVGGAALRAFSGASAPLLLAPGERAQVLLLFAASVSRLTVRVEFEPTSRLEFRGPPPLLAGPGAPRPRPAHRPRPRRAAPAPRRRPTTTKTLAA